MLNRQRRSRGTGMTGHRFGAARMHANRFRRDKQRFSVATHSTVIARLLWSVAVRHTHRRHRPARPGDPVFRGVGDGAVTLRRTGSSAFAEDDNLEAEDDKLRRSMTGLVGSPTLGISSRKIPRKKLHAKSFKLSCTPATSTKHSPGSHPHLRARDGAPVWRRLGLGSARWAKTTIHATGMSGVSSCCLMVVSGSPVRAFLLQRLP